MRFRDRPRGGGDREMEPESAEYGGGSKMHECAYPQTVCSDGRTRVVRDADVSEQSTKIARPQPYPTGGRSEPGQPY